MARVGLHLTVDSKVLEQLLRTVRVEGLEDPETWEKGEAEVDYAEPAEIPASNRNGNGRPRRAGTLAARIWRQLPPHGPFYARDVWEALQANGGRLPATRNAFNADLSHWARTGKLKRLDVGQYERV